MNDNFKGKPAKTGNKKKNSQKSSTPFKRNNRYRSVPSYSNGLKPAAFTAANKTRLHYAPLSDNSIRVTGYDLISAVASESIIEGPFCTITCNPAYWEGTRISAIANSYSQYRPLNLRFDYYPQVSTMTSGNVVCGTLWNDVPSTDSIQQVLATSNGGRIFPVYEPEQIDIRLKTNLNQNLYNFQGYLDTDNNPFIFIAMTQQTNNIIPGYFMVSYQYDFKNPLGEGFDYSTDVKTAGQIDTNDVWDTTTAVLLSSTTVAAIGTKLIIKVVDGAIQFFLGGSRIGVLADTIFKLFRSRPRKTTKMQEEYQDLTQSNRISSLAITLEQTLNGSAVTNVVSLREGEYLSITDFVKFDSVMGDTEYSVVGGLFFKLEQVGTGRYNLSMYALANSVSNMRGKDYYVFVRKEGNVTNPGFCSQTTPLVIGYNECRCTAVTLHLQYGSGNPVECSLPILNNVDQAPPSVLADIALMTTEEAFGFGSKTIIGTGTSVLIPTVEWRLSRSANNSNVIGM